MCNAETIRRGTDSTLDGCKVSGMTMSAPAEDLLVALAGFIQTLIHVSRSGPDSDRMNTMQSGVRIPGSALIDALETFVQDTINAKNSSMSEVKNREQNLSENEGTTAEEDKHNLMVPHGAFSHVNWDNAGVKSHIWIKDDIRAHVFNKLPIRLLSFDSEGSNIRLIERDKVMQHIGDAWPGEIEKIKAELPELSWQEKMITFLNRRAGYAILSHTWIRDTPGDVVFRDWTARKLNPRGYDKIRKFCQIAAKDHGVTLAWMDTLCINKDSSSELDESIRSMYKWYREAAVCVVYLSETRHLDKMHRDSWFTRGWTLQELLAPTDISFYDSEWESLLRKDMAMVDLPFFPSDQEINELIRQKINDATTITKTELELCKIGHVKKIPLSRRLQLSVERNVTRAEDSVYSLMGLLGVQITTCYGEGQKRAFHRLMRELLSTETNIIDVFNYGRKYGDTSTALIPSSVTQFTYRTRVFDRTDEDGRGSLLERWKPLAPILLTHLGVRVPLLLVPGLATFPEDSRTKISFGRFSGEVTLEYWPLEEFGYLRIRSYKLMDSIIFEHDLAITRPHNDRDDILDGDPHIVTFGVLNFGSENGQILLPQTCLSVALDCRGLKPGNVAPSDNIKMIPTRRPTTFQLKCVDNVDKISKEELGKDGMQIAMLYL